MTAQIAIQALVQRHDAQDGSLVPCEAAKQLARQQGPFIDVLSGDPSAVGPSAALKNDMGNLWSMDWFKGKSTGKPHI